MKDRSLCDNCPVYEGCDEFLWDCIYDMPKEPKPGGIDDPTSEEFMLGE